MATITAPGTLFERAVATRETLHIWASALGCSAGEVTDVVQRAGLPIEKLWNSIAVAARTREVH